MGNKVTDFEIHFQIQKRKKNSQEWIPIEIGHINIYNRIIGQGTTFWNLEDAEAIAKILTDQFSEFDVEIRIYGIPVELNLNLETTTK